MTKYRHVKQKNNAHPNSSHTKHKQEQLSQIKQLPAWLLPRNIGHKMQAIFVLLASVFVYLNTLNHEFVLDDHQAIESNKDILPESPISDIFVHDYWGANITHPLSHKSYRPLTILTFRLNFLLHGYHTVGYHVLNIALHALASVLLHRLLISITSGFHADHLCVATFLASLCFAVHPIHTEAVANLAGRAEMLSGLFYLLSLQLYWNAATSQQTEGPWGWCWTTTTYLGSLCCGILSCLSKEIGFTLPPVLAALDILLISKKKATTLRIVALTIIAIALVVARWYLVGATQQMLHQRFWVDNRVLAAEPFARLLTIFYLHAYNVYLLFWPMSLCCDYGYDCIPFVNSLVDIRNVASLTLYLALAASGLYGLVVTWHRRDSKGSWRLTLFGLSWLMISFLPASHLLLPVGFVIAERVLYTPSMGFTLILAVALAFLIRRYPQATVIFMFLLLTVYCARTIQRNDDWHTDLALWYSALNVCPRSAKVRYTYAEYLLRHGRHEEAIPHAKAAMEIDPEEVKSYLWLGKAKLNLKQFNEALAAATQAFLLQPYMRQVVFLTREIIQQMPEMQYFTGPNDPFLVDAVTHKYIAQKIYHFLLTVTQYLNLKRLQEILPQIVPQLIERGGDIYN
jgi:tetratricopeptide (TPR) repeat protein